ncbi:MAG TPA: hypothetical protein VIK84_06055 [Haloplasmataceae bacterium]
MLDKIIKIIEITKNEQQRILSPKLIFNDNYLLSLIMYWFKNQGHFIVNSDLDRKICKAFQLVNVEGRYYINGTLETPFKLRSKNEENPYAESSATVSGVVGDFHVLYGKKKERIVLNPDANEFVVLETTINKPLKKGTKNLKEYHQIAKAIGCMIQTLSHLDNYFLDHLGLFVIAPQEMLKLESFKDYTYKPFIEKLIIKRAEMYGDVESFLDLFHKLFPRFDIDCIAYEDIIRFIKKNDNDEGELINRFYQRCLRYHGLNEK